MSEQPKGPTPFLDALVSGRVAHPKWWNATPKRDSLDCVERVLEHGTEDAFALPARPTKAVVDEVNRAMGALFDPEREKERLQAALHRALMREAELEKAVARLQDSNGTVVEQLDAMIKDRDDTYRDLDSERTARRTLQAHLKVERELHAATRTRAMRAETTLANILTAHPMRSNTEHHGGHEI